MTIDAKYKVSGQNPHKNTRDNILYPLELKPWHIIQKGKILQIKLEFWK